MGKVLKSGQMVLSMWVNGGTIKLMVLVSFGMQMVMYMRENG